MHDEISRTHLFGPRVPTSGADKKFQIIDEDGSGELDENVRTASGT